MTLFVPTSWSDTTEHRRKIAEAVNYLLAQPQKADNYWINSGLNVWQRGTTFDAASGIRYLADQWRSISNISTVSAEAYDLLLNELPGCSSPQKALRIHVNSGASNSSYSLLLQHIDDFNIFSGQDICFSIWCRSLTGYSKIALDFALDFGTGGSDPIGNLGLAVIDVDSDFSSVFISTQIPQISEEDYSIGANPHLQARIWLESGSDYNILDNSDGVFDFALPKLEFGTEPTAYVFEPKAKTWEDCQRFLEYGTSLYCGDVTSGGAYHLSIPFAVEKRATPDITCTDINNYGFPSDNFIIYNDTPTTRQFRTSKVASSTLAGGFYHFSWIASAEF